MVELRPVWLQSISVTPRLWSWAEDTWPSFGGSWAETRVSAVPSQAETRVSGWDHRGQVSGSPLCYRPTCLVEEIIKMSLNIDYLGRTAIKSRWLSWDQCGCNAPVSHLGCEAELRTPGQASMGLGLRPGSQQCHLRRRSQAETIGARYRAHLSDIGLHVW